MCYCCYVSAAHNLQECATCEDLEKIAMETLKKMFNFHLDKFFLKLILHRTLCVCGGGEGGFVGLNEDTVLLSCHSPIADMLASRLTSPS